jgi:GTPase
VVVVCPDIAGTAASRPPAARLEEFTGLARAIRLEIVFAEILRLRAVRPSTFIGGGQAERLREMVEEDGVELVLVDGALTPTQQRNLERATGAKVLDRTALILEIFGERAVTREGVLQVELAHLSYQKGRLVRSWTHLERQRGGGGFLGGPGETQIESDRRQLQERITVLHRRIAKVQRTRTEQRKSRRAIPFPLIALVGYTNAGKSSLFNQLTGAHEQARDQLFATLDTKVRRTDLPGGAKVLFSDTVGFVSELPTELVAAFRGTLEEVTDARVIVHVRDISSPQSVAEAADVEKILADIGVDPARVPLIEVWNKIDLVTPERRAELLELAKVEHIDASGQMRPRAFVLSATTGQGCEALLAEIEARIFTGAVEYEVMLAAADGKRLSWLYENGDVLSRAMEGDDQIAIRVRIGQRVRTRFLADFSDTLAAPMVN